MDGDGGNPRRGMAGITMLPFLRRAMVGMVGEFGWVGTSRSEMDILVRVGELVEKSMGRAARVRKVVVLDMVVVGLLCLQDAVACDGWREEWDGVVIIHVLLIRER